jgi:hypothetical protein
VRINDARIFAVRLKNLLFKRSLFQKKILKKSSEKFGRTKMTLTFATPIKTVVKRKVLKDRF